jgi:alcohol dehydrogenase
MRAVIHHDVAGPLRIVELPDPDCPADGVVVGVRATGVCRSDWHAWRGHDPVELPHVPGHEFAGVVLELGTEVTGFAAGDRVTAPFVQGCGVCEWCRSGQAQVCPDQAQPGFTHPGSFAEKVVVRAAATNLVRLPDSLPAESAAALGCRFATAYHGLLARAALRAGEWVAVFGCGGVGLSAVLVARAAGARVVAVDPSPRSRQRALDLGAELALVAPGGAAAVTAATGGAHVSVDAYGSAATAAAAVASLRRRGRHVQLGLMLGADAGAGLPWELVIARELTVVGGHGMPAVEYPAMLRAIAEGSLQPELLIERVIGFDDLPAALAALDDPMATAGVVVATLV